jgi:hypothetical protein
MVKTSLFQLDMAWVDYSNYLFMLFQWLMKEAEIVIVDTLLRLRQPVS